MFTWKIGAWRNYDYKQLMATMKKCNIIPDVLECDYWATNLNNYKESVIRVQALTSFPYTCAPLHLDISAPPPSQSKTFPSPECYHEHSKT